MLYGTESCIPDAVALLEDIFTQQPPYYSAQPFSASRLRPDVFDKTDPECSWSVELGAGLSR